MDARGGVDAVDKVVCGCRSHRAGQDQKAFGLAVQLVLSRAERMLWDSTHLKCMCSGGLWGCFLPSLTLGCPPMYVAFIITLASRPFGTSRNSSTNEPSNMTWGPPSGARSRGSLPAGSIVSVMLSVGDVTGRLSGVLRCSTLVHNGYLIESGKVMNISSGCRRSQLGGSRLFDYGAACRLM
jgi:hypothetical protein